MDYDLDKIDDTILALLCLTLHDEAYGTARAWKVSTGMFSIASTRRAGFSIRKTKRNRWC
jgi:hypothetical protein